MKNKISILIVSTIVLFGCGKENVSSNEISTAMFINASPGNSVTTHNVVVDGVGQTGTALVYRGASPYLNIAVGARKIDLKSSNIAAPVTYASLNESFVNNTASTFIAYDLLATPSGTLKTVRLNDDLTAPKTGFLKFRTLHLVIGAPAVDITYLRTSNVLPALPDSVTVSNLSYLGPNPSSTQVTSMSSFIELPGGTYLIKVKLAGTQTVLSSGSSTSLIAGAPKGIYTFFLSGNLPTTPLAINLVRNFP